MKRVVIIGAGFGGINAVRGLSGQEDVEVVLADRQNYHLFQPLLYQVATASVEDESIAFPTRTFLHWQKGHMRFRMAEVNHINLDERRVETNTGPLDYDYLIIAAGAQTNYFGVPGAEEHTFNLKRMEDATAIHAQIITAFEMAAQENDPARRREILTFAIVGGGPTGVELAGALAELISTIVPDEYPEFSPDEARIVIIEMMEHLLMPYSDELSEYTEMRLRDMGVEVWLNTKVIEAREDRLIIEDRDDLVTETIIWVTGVKPVPLIDDLDVEKAKFGALAVDEYLTISGYPEVFAVGDIVYFEQDGEQLPWLAPVAMQMGEYAGKAVLKRARGEELEPFRYFDRGTMAVIGRGAAVADIRGRELRGVLAWLAWLGLHIHYLIGIRNKLAVLINWASDYLFFERRVKLVTQYRQREREEEATPSAAFMD